MKFYKPGELVIYKFTLPEDHHKITYRGFGYIDSWNEEHLSPSVCTIHKIEDDIITVMNKRDIKRNFGKVDWQTFKKEYPEWTI